MPSTKRKADDDTATVMPRHSVGGDAAAAAPPRRVFCDLDGVLCDFDGGVVRACGAEPSALEPRRMWPRLSRVGGAGFFAGLEWAEGGRELWRALVPLASEGRLKILTGCPLGEWAAPQKFKWCGRHLGVAVRHLSKAGPAMSHVRLPSLPPAREAATVDVITCWTRNKHLEVSGPDCVLLDDNAALADAWESAGGIFVHHTDTPSSLVRLGQLGLLLVPDAPPARDAPTTAAAKCSDV